MSTMIKFTLLASTLGLLAQSPALAADEYNVSTGVTTAGVPLGLHGVDPVTLSSFNAVAEGDAVHTVVNDGVAYYFASKQSADTFSENPEKYLPQYGGFCAYAVAKGKKFDGDPVFGDIVDGKLYLFVNAAIFEEYMKDRKEILARAEKTWPSIRHKAAGDL